jgi:hypothetical protein
MIATARAQLIGAHLERWGLATIDRVFTPLLDTGGRSTGAHARSLLLTSVRRTAIGRKLLLGLAGITAGAVALVALAGALATHLIAL